jgi:hypothetical protein
MSSSRKPNHYRARAEECCLKAILAEDVEQRTHWLEAATTGLVPRSADIGAGHVARAASSAGWHDHESRPRLQVPLGYELMVSAWLEPNPPDPPGLPQVCAMEWWRLRWVVLRRANRPAKKESAFKLLLSSSVRFSSKRDFGMLRPATACRQSRRVTIGVVARPVPTEPAFCISSTATKRAWALSRSSASLVNPLATSSAIGSGVP